MNAAAATLFYSDLPRPDRYAGRHEQGEVEVIGPEGEPPQAAPVAFANRYVTILNDHVRFPTGRTGQYLRIFHNAQLQDRHGTIVVPTYGDEVYFIRLFRHPTRSWQVEFPRGFAEPGLTPADNARKELAEELGVEAADTKELGTVAPDTGLLATRAPVFHATLKSRPALRPTLNSQAAEAIASVLFVTRSNFLQCFRSGRDPVLNSISCGLTLSAMMLAVGRGILT